MELTVDHALQKAVEAHKAGQVQEADRLYTAILKVQPKHPDANHNMGVLAVGVGKVEQSLPFFTTALEANPKVAQFWLNYIDALIKLERLADAKAVLDQAKSNGATGDGLDKLEQRLKKTSEEPLPARQIASEPQPQQPNILDSLKLDQALTLAKKKAKDGSPEDSERIYQDILEKFPKNKRAIDGLKRLVGRPVGNTSKVQDPPQDQLQALINLYSQGQLQEALQEAGTLVHQFPQSAILFNIQGAVLQGLGQLDAAIEAYNKALAIKPDYADAYNNMGNALKEQGKLEEAIEAYNEALAIKPDYADAYNNMGVALKEQGKLEEAIEAYNKALAIKPDYANAFWNLSGTANNILEAKDWIKHCLSADPKHVKAKLTLCALQFYEGDKSEFNALMQSSAKEHPYMRSYAWAFDLPVLPELYFHRWALFDRMVEQSQQDRPFYEYGVWRGQAFQYLIKTFKKGYGFDTFEGLPEDWHNEKAGTYSSDGNIPQIEGGKFIVGKFEDTLPEFFSEPRPKASIINFDADLYSSTICALNFSKPVIDRHTILIFDEFIVNKNWEQDEYKALNEFCLNNNCSYEVLAISFFTKQAAVRLIGI